jgi:hypothetical protein
VEQVQAGVLAVVVQVDFVQLSAQLVVAVPLNLLCL